MLTAVATVTALPPRADDDATTSPRPRQMAVAEMPEIAARPAAATAVAITRAAPLQAAAPQAVQSGDSGLRFSSPAAPSEDAANAFWQSLARRFPEVLGRREPTVIRFEHAGTVFWRVRTEGFGTLAEAQSLCVRMRAEGQACFVSRS